MKGENRYQDYVYWAELTGHSPAPYDEWMNAQSYFDTVVQGWKADYEESPSPTPQNGAYQDYVYWGELTGNSDKVAPYEVWKHAIPYFNTVMKTWQKNYQPSPTPPGGEPGYVPPTPGGPSPLPPIAPPGTPPQGEWPRGVSYAPQFPQRSPLVRAWEKTGQMSIPERTWPTFTEWLVEQGNPAPTRELMEQWRTERRAILRAREPSYRPPDLYGPPTFPGRQPPSPPTPPGGQPPAPPPPSPPPPTPPAPGWGRKKPRDIWQGW